MKKIILSSFVVVTFILYSLQQRNTPLAESTPPAVISPTYSPSQPNDTPFNDTPIPTSISKPKKASGYKDGQYTGSVADAFYGNIQVKASISNGKITDVQFLQYPSDRRTSIEINTQAMPYLRQEAIQAQSPQVDIVTGATDSSKAFIESLTSALSQSK